MKKHTISILLLVLLFSIFILRFYNLRFKNNNYYIELYNKKSTKYIYGQSQNRGRILDTNGNILVDNKKVNIITYRKIGNITLEEEITLAYKLITLLDLTKEANEDELKRYYMLTENTDYLIAKEDKDKIKYRYITDDEVYNLKYNKISEEIKKYTLKDRIAIHTYYLMNKGYFYDTKILQESASDNICMEVLEKDIKGLTCDYYYIRENKYDTLKSIFGNIGSIQKEDYDYYKSLDYQDNDLVGISGLELYYEKELHSTKDKYILNNDNSITLIEEGTKGKDIILNIDIDIQKELENIQKKTIEKVLTMKNTKYFNKTYAIISNPTTGGILAISGIKKTKNGYIDVTSDILLNSYTVGSVIKGASSSVGYLNNVIDIHKSYKDSCIKIYGVPKKCSYKELGYLNDITALKNSSNYYQFLTAIRVSGNKYKYNMKLDITEENFKTYRDIFKLYGLGSSTGIDFPKENIGITGKNISSDLYLNLAIGQYDTYTPIQLLSYINTIASRGTRYQLSFLKKEKKVLNELNLDSNYMERIIEGFYQVVNGGTANNYIKKEYQGVGKTGTAQSYYDGKITTINTSFAAFLPRNNPEYSIVILNPNISFENDGLPYNAPMSRLMSEQITNYLFTTRRKV